MVVDVHDAPPVRSNSCAAAGPPSKRMLSFPSEASDNSSASLRALESSASAPSERAASANASDACAPPLSARSRVRARGIVERGRVLGDPCAPVDSVPSTFPGEALECRPLSSVRSTGTGAPPSVRRVAGAQTGAPGLSSRPMPLNRLFPRTAAWFRVHGALRVFRQSAQSGFIDRFRTVRFSYRLVAAWQVSACPASM